MLPVSIPIYSHLEVGSFFRITDIGTLISAILGGALMLAGVAFVLYFLWGAMRWLTAGGDKAQIENSRQKITNAFIGLTLVAVTWAVYLLVIYFLGLGGVINVSGNDSSGGPGVVGNADCVCGGAGGCATTGQIGPIGFGGACYQCTDSGWVATGGACSPITCAACP